MRHARANRHRHHRPDPPAVGPEFWIGVANCLVLTLAIAAIVLLLVLR